MPRSIDETKKKLGLESLNESERKEYYQQFVDHGGKVIEEEQVKPKTPAAGAAPAAQRKVRGVEVVDTPDSKDKYLRRRDAKQADRIRQSMLNRKAQVDEKLTIFFQSVFQGVVSFWSPVFATSKFYEYYKHEIMPVYASLSSLAVMLTVKDIAVRQLIKDSFTGKQEFYYDLLVRLGDLYDLGANTALLSAFEKSSGGVIRAQALEMPLKEIFKALYVLNKNRESAYICTQMAINTWATATAAKKKDAQTYLRSTHTALDILFGACYKKVFALLCVGRQLYDAPGSRALELYLDIKPEDVIGFRKPDDVDLLVDERIHKYQVESGQVKPDEPQAAAEQEQQEEKAEEPQQTPAQNGDALKDSVKEGLRLHREIDLSGWRAQFSKTEFRNVPQNDKLAFLYILLKEFEKEYSFILTSSKVEINPASYSNQRMSYKDKMNNMYSGFRAIIDECAEYFRLVKEYQDIESDSAMGQVEKYNRLKGLDVRKKDIAYRSRKSAYTFLTDMESNLRALIDDYNGEKRLLMKADETLHFDKQVEGKKKVHGYTVINALIQVYNYVCGVMFRLEDEGDLSGFALEFDDAHPNITASSSGAPQAETQQQQPKTETSRPVADDLLGDIDKMIT